MNNLKRTALLLAISFSALLVAGCDRVPRTIYEIETIDGKTLKLACPTIDIERSELTYLIEGECVAVK